MSCKDVSLIHFVLVLEYRPLSCGFRGSGLTQYSFFFFISSCLSLFCLFPPQLLREQCVKCFPPESQHIPVLFLCSFILIKLYSFLFKSLSFKSIEEKMLNSYRILSIFKDFLTKKFLLSFFPKNFL